MSVRGIDAVYYTVKDIKGLTDFYTELLGAPPTMQWEGRLAEWTFADDNAFGLYGGQDGYEKIGNGSAMFAVDDVAAAVAAAKSRGVKFMSGEDGEDEITDTPTCHMAFGEDTEGNQFILHHRK